MATESRVSQAPVTGDDAVPPTGGVHDDIEKILFSEAQIKARVAEIGAELSAKLEGEVPLLVGVLTGAFVFVADLARAMTIPAEVDFLAASSYGSGTKSSGNVRFIKDLTINPRGRSVVIVEDIVDSGLTLMTLGEVMSARGAKSVRFVALFDKKARREHPIPDMEVIGFNCPDEFIVGYGVDYASRYRTLPYIGVLKSSVYRKAAEEKEGDS